MKNLFVKALFAVAILVMSNLAVAVCYTNANQIPEGSLSLYPATGWSALCTDIKEARGESGQGVTLITTQQPIILQRVPTGQVFNNCTAEQQIHRAGLMAAAGTVIGGLGGLLIGDNGRAAGKGAGAGLIGGALYAMSTECRVAVPQGNVAGQVFQPGQTVSGQSSCDVGDLKGLKGLSEADCKRISVALAEKPKESTGATSVNTATGTAIPNVCAWIHPGTKTRYDKPAEDNRSCPDFVKEVASRYGYSIAYRQ